MKLVLKAEEIIEGDFLEQEGGIYLQVLSVDLFSDKNDVILELILDQGTFGKSLAKELEVVAWRASAEDIENTIRLEEAERRIAQLVEERDSYLAGMRSAHKKTSEYRKKWMELENAVKK